MTITEEVLEKSITGESNAIRKYKRFAEIAVKENLPNIAYLFKALVMGEGIHAENHRRALDMKYEVVYENFKEGTTLENLQASIDGEHWEHTDMYPRFIKQNKKEIKKANRADKANVADLSMTWAKEVEMTHEEILTIALESLKMGKDLAVNKFYVCKVCGNLFMGDDLPKEVCPVCKHDPYFISEVAR